jgi:hypothetical protein
LRRLLRLLRGRELRHDQQQREPDGAAAKAELI